MYIGNIYFKKDLVENVLIEGAEDVDDAIRILADYVYHTYNKTLVDTNYFYNGIVIDTSNLKTITKPSLTKESVIK